MTDKEKEILEATKYFAESNDLPYDTFFESMILNAIREATKPLKQQNAELLEALKLSRENKGLLTEAEGVFDSIKVSDNIKRKVDDKFNDLDQKTEEK